MATKYRSIKLILLTTFSGCLLGTLLNNLCRSIIPENTVISGLFKSQTITILPEGSIIDLGILIEIALEGTHAIVTPIRV